MGCLFKSNTFTNKWGTWTDIHLRTKEDFVSDLSQSILRFGLTYYLNDDTKLTAGYAYVSHYPAEGHKNVTSAGTSALASNFNGTVSIQNSSLCSGSGWKKDLEEKLRMTTHWRRAIILISGFGTISFLWCL
jgi:hypothetical protein